MAQEKELTPAETWSEARECIAAGKRIGTLEADFRIGDHKGTPVVVMGDRYEFREDLRDTPKRIASRRELRELLSFANYASEFKTANTRLYAADDLSRITAVFDDHAPGAANWGDHAVALVLEPSDEWVAWTGIHKKSIGHLDFVEFLQERISTIARPDASCLLDAARKFSSARNATFSQVIPVEGGDMQVAYSEELRGTSKEGSATIPQRLTLMLRPYKNGKAYPVDAQVRWRLPNNTLTFSVCLLETDRVLETAFRDVRDKIAEETGLTVLV